LIDPEFAFQAIQLNQSFIEGSYRISIIASANRRRGGSMMRTAGFVTAAAVGMALSGCVIVDANVKADWEDHGGFGYVMSAEVSPRGPDITITAHSNGCTNKEDFEPIVKARGDGHFDVGFRRREPDHCKALMPEGRTMTWSFSELGLPRDAGVMVLNPVGR
jgi:hypothetical protein